MTTGLGRSISRKRDPLDRRQAWTGLCSGLALALAACGPGPVKSSQDGERELLVAAPWEMNSLDPSRTGFLYSRMQVAETLFNTDDAGQPTPGLASAWMTSPDGLTWRMTLREGAAFQDGKPVTADDVVAALNRAKANPGVLTYAPITGIAAQDGQVVITLAQPSALLPSILAQYSTQILAPSSFDSTGAVVKVVGSGPYQITHIDKQGFAVQLSKAWSGPVPDVKRARYVSVSRDETRALMAESGQADIVINLDAISLERLRKRADIKALATMIPRTSVLVLNAGGPEFSEPRAREALSLAIDRTGIAKAVIRDPSYAATQLFPPVMQGWFTPDLPALTTDRAKTETILAALGWRRGPDGILQRNGKRFALQLLTYSDRPELPPIATAIQAQLKQVGIDVSIDIEDSAEIPVRHKSGTLQLALMARTYVVLPNPVGTLLQDFTLDGGDLGPLGWSDPGVVDALRKLSRGGDPAAAPALRRQIAQTLQSQLPVVPVIWYQQTAIQGARIRNLSLDPFERTYRLTAVTWAKP